VKGCPLRCLWCANPESQNFEKEIAWTKSECIGCKSCTESTVGEHFRFEEDGLYWEDFTANSLEEIRNLCPATALHVFGETKTVDEVMTEVIKDEIFYSDSGGGITVSGGEPLSQGDFTYELLKKAGENGIHRCMETTGFAHYETLSRIARELDYLLMDIKCINEEVHKKYTGVSNQVILENVKRLRAEFPHLPIQIRTPVIPGVNDSEEAISAVSEFVAAMPNTRYELLRYHRLGEPKYESLHRVYPLGEKELSEERFKEFQSYEFNHLQEIQ
jgi:pyruvate formate lyase activating enzyme